MLNRILSCILSSDSEKTKFKMPNRFLTQLNLHKLSGEAISMQRLIVGRNLFKWGYITPQWQFVQNLYAKQKTCKHTLKIVLGRRCPIFNRLLPWRLEKPVFEHLFCARKLLLPHSWFCPARNKEIFEHITRSTLQRRKRSSSKYCSVLIQSARIHDCEVVHEVMGSIISRLNLNHNFCYCFCTLLREIGIDFFGKMK